MTDPKIIKLPLFDLRYNKIREGIEHFIELHPRHLVWKLHCYLDIHPKEDDDFFTVKENEYFCNVDVILKDKIGSIESYFDNKYELWVVAVWFGDRSTDCKFETEASMRKVEKELHNWITQKD